ncbi:hypothetical protein GT045_19830 [Streptomyces sp. SID486]|nr:hypothetical protein [Streptomyces sp. SID2955]MYW41895.1 hypothetical protein [Streptomyces sp. SID161]MYX97004.1 hypothetical protein [Streptomyces sp. SID486]
MTQVVDELTRRLAPDTLPAPSAHRDTLDQARRQALARLRVLTGVKEALRHLEDQAARAAADGGAGYPDIGRAMRMSRQGARRRWPGLVTDSTPRPNHRPTYRSS